MFEEMTYENIMADMMADMPDDVSTREGSLIYNACAKQALKIEEVYITISEIWKNINVETMDEEHLVPYAKENRIDRKKATVAVVKGKFLQEIEIGTRFSLKEEVFIATKKISDYVYELECETTGIQGNVCGNLELIDFITNFQGGTVTEILIPAQEQEDIEEIRKKVLESYGIKNFSGNKAAYKTFINAIDGVGGCRVQRRKEGDLYIRPCIIASNLSPPSKSLIEKVQTLVDPEQNRGEGEGLAPVDHKVMVEGAQEKEINIKIVELTLESGYEKSEIKIKIENKIDNYFEKLKKEWEEKEELIIKTYQILADIINIEGINDLKGILLNEEEKNIILKTEIPKRGDIIV